MRNTRTEAETTSWLFQWGREREDIRALLLTGSRANPNAHLDVFSDFDVIVTVKDIRAFLEDESWLATFGEVLVVYRDPVRLERGFECFCRVTNYRDGSKIDYTIWPTGLLEKTSQEPILPAYLDNGYKVLLDKDGLTERLGTPTFTAYILSRPGEKDYRKTIDDFFNDSIYLAKNIRRDNIFLVKLCLDNIMKEECLRRMLEWRTEIDLGWSAPAGAHGEGLKKYADPRSWPDLESTYVGAGHEENWQALFTTIGLFRKVASEVARHLGYSYPFDMDDQVVEYLHEIKDMG